MEALKGFFFPQGKSNWKEQEIKNQKKELKQFTIVVFSLAVFFCFRCNKEFPRIHITLDLTSEGRGMEERKCH